MEVEAVEVDMVEVVEVEVATMKNVMLKPLGLFPKIINLIMRFRTKVVEEERIAPEEEVKDIIRTTMLIFQSTRKNKRRTDLNISILVKESRPRILTRTGLLV